MSILSVKDLSAGYKRTPVISKVSVEANAGEFIALLGPNGSGKTTLVKALAGLLPVMSGDIWVGDTPLSFLEPKLRARRISYLAQSRQAMPDMSVLEILELGRAPFRGRLGLISDDGRQVIERVIETCALQDFVSRKYGELSGGEQARVLLGRALVVDAPVILVDEPIAALDPFYQLATLEILTSQARSGKTVIAALHDLSLAQRFSDRVWMMSEGQLALNAPASQAFDSEIIARVFNIDWDVFQGPLI